VAIHWSIITLGSGLLAMSLCMSGQVIDWFGTMGAGSNLRWLLSHAIAILASWVLLFLLYALMPNTHVSVKAAAAGALVAALLWEAAKFGFQIYVAKAVPYSAIYGSLGLIPLFLFWIYVTWLIVLFGLILTYTLQTLRGRRFIRAELRDRSLLEGDPDWMLPIMSEVAHSFAAGEPIDNQDLADRLGLSSRVTHEMVAKLIEAEMLRRASDGPDENETLVLARPAEKISVPDILSLAHQARPTSNHPAWKSLVDLKAAERAAAAGLTLADVAG
jgi:membrane protein